MEKVNKRIHLAKKFSEIFENFTGHIRRNYDLKNFEKKLEKIYEISFKEFWQEVKKQKIKVSPEDEEVEAKYFDQRANELSILVQNMKTIDKELDEMTYEIYKITDS